MIFGSNFSVHVPMLMRSMAEYFCRFEIYSFSDNLYSRFLDSTKDSLNELEFGTLNYDLLLEHAATSKDIVTNYFLERHDSNEILLWKLHGSCNFLPVNIQFDNKIQFESGIVWDTTLKGVDPREAYAFCKSNTGLYPAMCLYMKSKPTQIGYTQIQKVRVKWNQAVNNATKVLIIGVRPYLADTHVWGLLTKTKARIGYVGSMNGYNHWIVQGRDRNNSEFLGQRWHECFDNTIEFIF